ncbi:hypothetical protein AZ012_003336 [Citrobacter amalonaticus]|nr:hypothetical protein AZ012_003336 [Citrobacter amalonaticus]
MGLRPHVLHGTGRFETEPPAGFKHGHRLDTVLLQMKLGEGIVLCQKIRVLCSEAGIREHLPPSSLFQSLTCFINDFLTIFLSESRFLSIWKDIQNHLGRTTQFSSQWRHHNRTVNQDRMLQHKV